jgi:hypothetical protein
MRFGQIKSESRANCPSCLQLLAPPWSPGETPGLACPQEDQGMGYPQALGPASVMPGKTLALDPRIGAHFLYTVISTLTPALPIVPIPAALSPAFPFGPFMEMFHGPGRRVSLPCKQVQSVPVQNTPRHPLGLTGHTAQCGAGF